MVHPLVTRLQFTRLESVRCLQGVTAEEARIRIKPMNCLSWILGHVAAQEQYLWLEHGLGAAIEADLCKRVGFRQPASTPDWQGMWELWHTITSAADKFLATIPQSRLDDVFVHENPRIVESVGISLLRNLYHCWHHQGEAYATRQLLRHSDLPVFVGSMDGVRVK